LTSAELAVLVLVGVGAVASLVLWLLWPVKPPRLPEEAINDSTVAQQWGGGLDHAGPPALPSHHGGIDGGGSG
jgi:hypothetical protein